MRGRWWWAIGVVVVLATAVGARAAVRTDDGASGTGGSGDRVEVGITDVRVGSDALTVVGWIVADEPPEVDVRTERAFTTVVADQARFDLDAAYPPSRHWGFVAELPDVEAVEVCASSGPALACRPLACRDDVFGDGFRAELEDRMAAGTRITAQVVDTRTGCHYDLEPGLVITTASVMKLEILGDLLLDAQRADRDLTVWEREQAEVMMRYSLNDVTAALYSHVGGVASLTGHSRLVGATDTTHTAAFGTTSSTAADRNRVVLAVLAGEGELAWAGVEQAWDIMRTPARPQTWGASAGVPSGWAVRLKNGFFPYQQFRWRLGTTGFVADPGGGGYAVTIMTDGNVDQRSGVDVVEYVAAHVADKLTWGPPADRPFDGVECVTHTGGGSWSSLTAELGLAPTAVADVRRAAGGDGPLRGHLVCTP